MATAAEPLSQSASSPRFDVEIIQIAHILHRDEGNARQLVVRAQKHVADGRRTPASSAELGIVPNGCSPQHRDGPRSHARDVSVCNLRDRHGKATARRDYGISLVAPGMRRGYIWEQTIVSGALR